jgi:hypothetical protein
VLESEEQATSVMNAMAEPAFLQCGIDYQAADAGTNCCDGEKSLPEPLGFVQPSAPPFETVGDQLNFYTWATSWVDQNGVEHGQDDRLIGAFVRVGRAIVYVEGLVESSDTEPIVTPESFRQILENVVARAEAVLSGVEYEPPATTTLQPLSDAEVASSMMLTGDEYGPDWVVVPNMEPGVSINSAVAAEIPECVSFVDPVFRAVEQGSSTYRSFYHAEPQALFTQYVVVLRDAATARSVYELVNSPEFAACVTGHGTAVAAGASPSAFPSPVDKPISEPPFEPVGDALSYRTFEEIVRGPRTDLDAVMLVGRTITFMGTVVNGEGGATLNTADQFRLALERVVERANAVLAGTPVR